MREFLFYVMVIPPILSFLWISVFGGSALSLQTAGTADILSAVNADVSTALFEMLKHFPFSWVLSIVGIVLVTIFFVTSSDSGSLVVDHLTSGGKLDSPVPQRIFWAVMEGIIAAVLLLGGGLTILQTTAISTGLPFAFVLLLMVYSLYVGLSQELYVEDTVKEKLQSVREKHRFEEVVATVKEDLAEGD